MAFETINDTKQLMIVTILVAFIQISRTHKSDAERLTTGYLIKEDIIEGLDKLEQRCKQHFKSYYDIAVTDFNKIVNNSALLNIAHFLEEGIHVFHIQHVDLWQKYPDLLQPTKLVFIFKMSIIFLFKLAGVDFTSKVSHVIKLLNLYSKSNSEKRKKILEELSLSAARSVYETFEQF